MLPWIDVSDIRFEARFSIVGLSETTVSLAWFPSQSKTLVAGQGQKFLRVYDLRGKSRRFVPIKFKFFLYFEQIYHRYNHWKRRACSFSGRRPPPAICRFVLFHNLAASMYFTMHSSPGGLQLWINLILILFTFLDQSKLVSFGVTNCKAMNGVCVDPFSEYRFASFAEVKFLCLLFSFACQSILRKTI